MNNPSNTDKPRGRRFLLAGCVVLILTGLAHLAGHFAERPAPKSDDEAQLFHLMSSVKIDAAGTPLSVDQLLNGFSWFFSLSIISIGLCVVALARDAHSTRRAAILVLIFAALAGLISIHHFPAPPTWFFVVAGVMFLLAAARSFFAPRGV